MSKARTAFGLTTKLEAIYTAKAVVLATGTFLGGRVYVGDVSYESGPDGMFPATALATALKKAGSAPAPVQDRHPFPGERPQFGF